MNKAFKGLEFIRMVSWFLGEWDGLICSLIVFIAIEFITQIILAVLKRDLSKRINLKMLLQKVAMFSMVGVGHIIDMYLAEGGNAFRALIIFFYIKYEWRIIQKNFDELGLPYPKKLTEFWQKKTDDDE